MIKLKEAISLIAYDGGMWDAENTTKRTEAVLEAVRNKFTGMQVVNTEHFLGGLSDEDFETVCIGDADECMTIIRLYGMEIANEMLEYIFEGDHGL